MTDIDPTVGDDVNERIPSEVNEEPSNPDVNNENHVDDESIQKVVENGAEVESNSVLDRAEEECSVQEKEQEQEQEQEVEIQQNGPRKSTVSFLDMEDDDVPNNEEQNVQSVRTTQNSDLRWEALFGDVGEEEDDQGRTTQMTYASLFGSQADEEDELIAGDLDEEAQGEEMLALSLEDLFGEEPEPMHLTQSEQQYLQSATEVTELQIPRIPALPEEQKQQLYMAKIPLSLRFEERPYHPSHLPKELERNRDKVTTADNVVRWRHWGGDQVHSNARIVQWDNGDMHLFVGNEVYDISKHSMVADNQYLFSTTLGQTAICQHKFTASMRVRTTLSKKSKAADLLSRKIQTEFNKKILRRELKMNLTDQAPKLPPEARKELEKMEKKREKIMKNAGIMRMNDTESYTEEDAQQERAAARLHQIKSSAKADVTRRKRSYDDMSEDNAV